MTALAAIDAEMNTLHRLRIQQGIRFGRFAREVEADVDRDRLRSDARTSIRRAQEMRSSR